jgi:hypothetical protein
MKRLLTSVLWLTVEAQEEDQVETLQYNLVWDLRPQFFVHSFVLLGSFLQPLRAMVVEPDIFTKYKPFEDLSLRKSHDQLFWCSIGGDGADFFMVHELIRRG